MRLPGFVRSLTARLAVAFLGVAVAAVGVLAGLTLIAAHGQVRTLVEREREDTVTAVTGALADAYAEAGSWDGADLRAVGALVAAAPSTLEVRSAEGERVSGSGLEMANMMSEMHGGVDGSLGPTRSSPVVVDGAVVGTADLRFPEGRLPGPEQQLATALARTVLVGVLLAALLAAAVAALVARKITRPLLALTQGVRNFERGDRAFRVGLSTPVGELGELAEAFDRMAETVTRQEQQRRAAAADVAHELRTPVTILQASLEELVDGVAPPTGGRLSSLHDEVLRLRRIVEDLETLSTAEAAGLALERARVDLAIVAEAAAAALEPAFAAAGVKLITDLAPAPVDGDGARLVQVVTNLLSNALKFTPAGGTVALTVATRHDSAELIVSDTGPGIAADELPHVFERFWRGRQAPGIGGSGIGLAVVAGLVSAHAGEVRVDSAPGRGAAFTVRLPLPGVVRRA